MKKAVRDRIPEIIRKSGNSCRIKKLSDSKFLIELEKKLDEELDEYTQSKSVDELVDLVEVIYRIAELRGYPKIKFEKIRKNKKRQRGAFSKNIFADLGKSRLNR